MDRSFTALSRRTLLGSGAAALAIPRANAAQVANSTKLDLIATFPPRQATGVAVSPTGRVFVNFPRWEQDVPISVAEVGQRCTHPLSGRCLE